MTADEREKELGVVASNNKVASCWKTQKTRAALEFLPTSPSLRCLPVMEKSQPHRSVAALLIECAHFVLTPMNLKFFPPLLSRPFNE